MSGSALAATHYLITSTRQISPTVLKSLKGKPGPPGATGAAGPQGSQGTTGAPGTQGLPGSPGSPGSPGTNGKDGKEGHEGKEGPAGESAAYAHVEINESTEAVEVDQRDSSHFEGAKIVEPEEEIGVFCISGLKVVPRTVVATVDASESGLAPGITATTGAAANTECGKETQVTVETFESTLGENKAKKTVVKSTPIDEGFYIVIN